MAILDFIPAKFIGYPCTRPIICFIFMVQVFCFKLSYIKITKLVKFKMATKAIYFIKVGIQIFSSDIVVEVKIKIIGQRQIIFYFSNHKKWMSESTKKINK